MSFEPNQYANTSDARHLHSFGYFVVVVVLVVVALYYPGSEFRVSGSGPLQLRLRVARIRTFAGNGLEGRRAQAKP